MRIILRTAAAAFLTISALALLWAHPLVLKGAVVAVEPTKVTMRFVDPDTKKTVTEAFQIDKETKILRGDKVVTFADAEIIKGEPIAITVDLDNDEHLADLIRLDAKKR